MKKLINTLLIVLLCSGAYAQWSAGARAGVNICKTTGKWNDIEETKNKFIAGPTFLGMANYQFSDVFSLRGEIGYTVMGGKTETTVEARAINSVLYRERFNCLQINFAAQYFIITSLLRYFLLTGIYYNYKGNGVFSVNDGENQKVGWGDSGSRNMDKILLDPDLNRRGDIGIQIGGGAGKELGPGRLDLDLRFGYGFLDLSKFPEGIEKPDGYKSYHNMFFSITVGYWYLFNDK
jgi:hypothetical protein